MEDVVLHYQPGSAAGVSSLLERTEKILEPFPCRTPVVFIPWFSTSSADYQLPIRPAKPAPVITSSGDGFFSDNRPHTCTTAAETNKLQELKGRAQVTDKHNDLPGSETKTSPEKTEKSKDAVCITETSKCLLPDSPCNKPDRGLPGLSSRKQPQKCKDVITATDCQIKRSWSVFTQRGVVLQSSQSLSKQFNRMVSTHRLHLHQRAKWVISEDNCSGSRNIEQVWRTLSRAVWSAKLPTCNANIQRERAEVWVFCDILYSEQVGRFLKDELQLSGRISLSVYRLGNILSL